jgi:hypothetical protein
MWSLAASICDGGLNRFTAFYFLQLTTMSAICTAVFGLEQHFISYCLILTLICIIILSLNDGGPFASFC